MDEKISKLNQLIRECYVVRERLQVAASNYRDLGRKFIEADYSKDPQMYSEIDAQMKICDEESFRISATVLYEWPYLVELYYQTFYESKKNLENGEVAINSYRGTGKLNV